LQGCKAPDSSTRGGQGSLARHVLGCSAAMPRHRTSTSVRSRACALLGALARVDIARIFLGSTAALALASSAAADMLAGSAMKQAAAEGGAHAQASETIDHEIRIVWVLAESRSMSEAGPVTGVPEIVVYEVECTQGRLVAANRTQEAYAKYGSRTWVVQIDQPVMSSDGATVLRMALEGVCQSQRR